ncbi:MAG: class I SAM-dependent methyltransferase [Myxococcota bacterium]
MSERDRERWDARFAGEAYAMGRGPKPILLEVAEALPRAGRALDVACGEGQTAAWLAERGLGVDAVDVSSVALDKARALAESRGVGDRVRFVAQDLDEGLPEGLAPAWDLITCLYYRNRALVPRLVERLVPGGLLLLVVLTRDNLRLNGAQAPRAAFLAERGELLAATRGLDLVLYREGVVRGRAVAQLLAQRPPSEPLVLVPEED